MARNRPRQQLALQLEPKLVARIKAEAAARGCTISALVAGWCDQGLSGPAPHALADMPPAPLQLEQLSAQLGEVLDRLAALECDVARLRQG